MHKIKWSSLPVAWLVCIVMVLSCKNTVAQQMPSFQLQLTNGKTFSSQSLSHLKPTIIIYFAPDCEHCQVLMDIIFKKLNAFKNVQMVMVTFKPINEVVDFEKHYQTQKYQNIQVGTELPILFFQKYYKLEKTPFTALYDKQQKLVVSYKNDTPVDDLLKQLKQLK